MQLLQLPTLLPREKGTKPTFPRQMRGLIYLRFPYIKHQIPGIEFQVSYKTAQGSLCPAYNLSKLTQPLLAVPVHAPSTCYKFWLCHKLTFLGSGTHHDKIYWLHHPWKACHFLATSQLFPHENLQVRVKICLVNEARVCIPALCKQPTSLTIQHGFKE